jgi:hypothetical protein
MCGLDTIPNFIKTILLCCDPDAVHLIIVDTKKTLGCEAMRSPS